MTGPITFHGAHEVGNRQPTVVENEHDPKVSRVVRELAGATEYAQHVFKGGADDYAAGYRVARGLRHTNLIGEGAPNVLGKAPIGGGDYKRHAVLREDERQRTEVRVERVGSDESAQVRGSLASC